MIRKSFFFKVLSVPPVLVEYFFLNNSWKRYICHFVDNFIINILNKKFFLVLYKNRSN